VIERSVSVENNIANKTSIDNAQSCVDYILLEQVLKAQAKRDVPAAK
jgi:hypothetical protein